MTSDRRVPSASRAARKTLLRWVFGRVSKDEVSRLEPGKLLPLIVALGVEAHLLWRLEELTSGKAPTSGRLEQWRQALAWRCRENALANLRSDALVRRQIKRLQQAGIPVMLLKGTALRARYPELSGRPQCDTDIMVRRGDVEGAEAVLSDEGYIVDEKFFTRDQYLNDHFDLRMIKEGHAIELHWAMSTECSEGAAERSWSRAEQIEWGGVPAWLPSIEDQIVFTQVHMSRHGFGLGLRWMADLAFEAERWPGLERRLKVVRRDWPSRPARAPMVVAADHGLRVNGRALVASDGGPLLERKLFSSLCRAQLLGRRWWGLSPWYAQHALSGWLSGDRSTVSRSLIRVLLRGGWGYARRQGWRGATARTP